MSDAMNYTSISGIKKSWLDLIAPNYFDLDNVNNYNIGILGYINEVMANSVEDAQNATNIARREFYPATAQYISSFYKMATVQNIDIPMATPAHCSIGLLIDQKNIIDNSTYDNGVYTCVIDNTLKIMADNLQFMLDYPIVILSKKAKTGWTHTIHYDITYSNSLSDDTESKYISSKVIQNTGVSYLLLMIDAVRQVEMVSVSNLILRDTALDSVMFDIDYSGNLANFEVFYRENQTSGLVQLRKILVNGAEPEVPFCYYDHINNAKIRLIFPANNTFTPAMNSEIITRIYTSQGANGNFDKFDGSLTCSSDSEEYPYNSNIMITGLTNGSCIGGRDTPTMEEFRNQILKAYSTNKTYTTSNDLQIYFDDLSNDIDNMRVMFRKKRDDALIRLFGAYTLLKDESNNVVPTNTLAVALQRSDVMALDSNATRVMILPGTIFKYRDPSSSSDYTAIPVDDGRVLTDDLDEADTLFTNPFLIGINLNPNTIGYYLNSIDQNYTMDYSFVNDNTENQFITKNVNIKRNSMAGADYYRISLNISAASSGADLAAIGHINDKDDEGNIIRAKLDGRVISSKFIHDGDTGHVELLLRYNDDSEERIVASNYIQKDPANPENFIYHTGYTPLVNPGDTFVKNDRIAIKNDDDLGKLRITIDFGRILLANQMYIPMTLETVNEEMGGFTYVAYISTDDVVDINSQIVITHGIVHSDGVEEDNLAIPMNGLAMTINAFFLNDDVNYEHQYSSYAYMKGYTQTNTYVTKSDITVDLIQEIGFIRSVVDFSQGNTTENYLIEIDEVPLLSAHWAKIASNYTYFVGKLRDTYDKLQYAYRLLENNFAIDLKFYNTYGRSRFYTVGITGNIQPLNNINCSFSFGVSLNTVTNQGTFIDNFRAFIKEYVEDTADATSEGKDIYMLNLITDLKTNFPEIGYLEYYGFNEFDHTAQKIIGPDLDSYLDNYIPEFLNVKNAIAMNGTVYPDITVVMLGN